MVAVEPDTWQALVSVILIMNLWTQNHERYKAHNFDTDGRIGLPKLY